MVTLSNQWSVDLSSVHCKHKQWFTCITVDGPGRNFPKDLWIESTILELSQI